MKKTFLKAFIIFSMIGGVMVTSTSCKKKGCTSETATNYDPDAQTDDGSCEEPEPEPEPTTEEPSNPQPQPDSADAVLIALQTVSYTETFGFTTETSIGLPVAIFLDGSNFKDAGTVTCETKELQKQDNNSYVFIPTASDALGVTYDGDVDWDVSGGAFPAFSSSSNGTFPSNVEINLDNTNISTSSDFTLETKSAISDADSVIFAVYGTEGQHLVTKVGTEYSHTFSASEMGSVGAGTGYVQITAYRVSGNETLTSGEKVYYINEKVNTTMVTFE